MTDALRQLLQEPAFMASLVSVVTMIVLFTNITIDFMVMEMLVTQLTDFA